MKNKITFLSLIMLFCLVACHKKVSDKVIQVTPKTAKEPVNIPITKIEDNLPKTPTIVNSIPKDMDSAIVVSLKRSPCFGKCPNFTIQLFAEGKATYQGGKYAAREGLYEAKVDDIFIKNILNKILTIKYLSLENAYPVKGPEIADLPTTTSYVRVGNMGKRIINNFDAPATLIDFERWLETEFEKLKWVAVKN